MKRALAGPFVVGESAVAVDQVAHRRALVVGSNSI